MTPAPDAPAPKRSTARRPCLVLAGVLTALVLLLPASALAQPPHLTIEVPRDGSVTSNSTPKFRGTTDDIFDELHEEAIDPVKLEIMSGESVVQSLATSQNSEAWSAVAAPLGDGTYTAQAVQTNALSEEGRSEPPVTFTVDSTPPQITMSALTGSASSSSGSYSVGGSAGTRDGDLPAVTLQLFAGAAIGTQAALETLVVQASAGSWSASFGGLAPGTYTAQAAQSDRAGNTGSSAPLTFVVSAPVPPPPPVASFKWFPPAPRTAESVSLVSSSTDSFSPITGFAWALSSSGPFSVGQPVLSTSFTTPGGHVVRLRVLDAEGRSSIATATISVSGRPTSLMQPFPIVRIAGSVTAHGARIRLLTVQAPVGATVAVTCRGHGCGRKAESRLATSSSKSRNLAGAVLLTFHRFQRALGAGAILRISVSKPGEIGKFTSFAIRRNRLPTRADACLRATSSKPIACPSS